MIITKLKGEKAMQIAHVLLWAQVTGLTLEWTAGGRTFQVTGDPRITGFYERFFGGAHPTRNRLSEAEAQRAFDQAGGMLIYRVQYSDGEQVTREEVISRARETLGV